MSPDDGREALEPVALMLPRPARRVDVTRRGEPRQPGRRVEIDPPLGLFRLEGVGFHQPMMEWAQQYAVG